MNNNNNSNNNNNNNNNDNRGEEEGWGVGVAATGIAAALVGVAAYCFTRDSKPKPQPAVSTIQKSIPSNNQEHSNAHSSNADNTSRSYLTNMISGMSTFSGSTYSKPTVGYQNSAPSDPVITNLNSLLADIYVRYIQLKEHDFKLHYMVFDKIFQDLHKKMKAVDPYYQKYSSTVQFAGSHYDNLRIKKPDEFDMDIVIGMPLNIKTDPLNPVGSDIIIEPKSAGFVQLRMGVQFQRLPMRDKEEWLVNRAAYEWKDDSNYLLRSKFTDWFKSVVMKALNKCERSVDSKPLYYIEGVPYTIDTSQSGPAITLYIRNRLRNFKLDVDLVPALKFPEERWPIGKTYRHIPAECRKGYWMVVGKPNKASLIQNDQMRSWRLALHNQERQLMYNSNNLRQAIRLMKKLRDAQGMDKIASYYIKTLFFWEIERQNNILFWQCNNPVTLFTLMVRRLYDALVAGSIPYYWNKTNNLIGSVDKRKLDEYAAKLVPLMSILERPAEYKLVAKYLLTPQEFADYNGRLSHM